VLLDPDARDIHRDWHAAATGMIGMLRMDLGRYPNDPKTTELIDELTEQSAEFREIWANGRVARAFTVESKVIQHPEVGPVHVHVEAVRIAEDPDQTLHVMIPGADEASQSAMRKLRALTELS
jgi:transcription regulator MmyB-like protein